MLPKRLDLPFWLSVGATALLMLLAPRGAPVSDARRRMGLRARSTPSASRKAPMNRTTSSSAGPTNVAAAVTPPIRCKFPGGAGTTSSGARTAR
jgi:hypothetical protein